MKNSLLTLILFIIIICLFPLSCFARTGYVSDMLFLTFRQGPGNSYASKKTLQSNTPVMILEEKNGFYKVELKSKEVGWVDKNFIIFTLPKTLMINKLEKENKNLSIRIMELESSVRELQDKLSSVKQNNMLSDTQGEKENKMLKEQTQTLSEELATIKGKNKSLFKTSMIKWFLTGAGVLLLGWIIGQSVSSKKQRSSSFLR
ncbi:MAG: TIGR04211 family SH3 domain-containing protein [Thermodesulfobacteriota bacterium]